MKHNKHIKLNLLSVYWSQLRTLNLVVISIVGVLLGVSLAGPPGPVTAIMVNRATKSVLGGFLVGMGAMTADFILMVLILLFGKETDLTRFNNYIFALGSFFFFYIAVAIYRSNGSETGSRAGSGYLAGLTIGLMNPMQIGWWFTAGLSVNQKFGFETFVFLFIGIVGWVLFLSFLIYKAASRYGNKVELGVKIFSILSLSFFGFLFLYLSIHGFTGIGIT